MSIYIAISGGKQVYRFVERSFASVPMARAYLFEMGVPATTKGTHFEHKNLKFELSHKYEDIYKHDKLPDTDISRSAHERLSSSSISMPRKDFGSALKKATSHLSGEPPSSPSPPSPATSSSAITITLKQLCEELKIEPTRARAKLRKQMPGERSRWEFTKEEEATVRRILGV